MNGSYDNVSSYFEECLDPSLCVVPNFEDNIPLAFGLTIAAGLATVLGAIPPLLPCIKHTNRKLLSGSLSLAAGVMLYVSFTEILLKSSNNFCCITSQHFTLATIGCFFGGILITVVLDSLVHLLERFDQSTAKRKCCSRVSKVACKGCCKRKYKGKEKPCSDSSDGNQTDGLTVSSDSSITQCQMDLEGGMCTSSKSEDGKGKVLEFELHSSRIPQSPKVVRRASYLSMVEKVREHIICMHGLPCVPDHVGVNPGLVTCKVSVSVYSVINHIQSVSVNSCWIRLKVL